MTISSNANIDEAAAAMKERNVGALLVVDGGRLISILTERDFFKLAVQK